jgi:hypothetical protein
MLQGIPSRIWWYLCSPINRPSHSFSRCGENISRNFVQKLVTSCVEMRRHNVLCFTEKLDVRFVRGLQKTYKKTVRLLLILRFFKFSHGAYTDGFFNDVDGLQVKFLCHGTGTIWYVSWWCLVCVVLHTFWKTLFKKIFIWVQ